MKRRNKRQGSIKPITEFIKYFHIPLNFIENREKKERKKKKLERNSYENLFEPHIQTT